MKHTFVAIVVGVLTSAIVSGVVYLEVSLWNECRETNSFLYCLRTLSK